MSLKLTLVINNNILSLKGVYQNKMSVGIAKAIITKKNKIQINSIPKLNFIFGPKCVMVVFIVLFFVVR